MSKRIVITGLVAAGFVIAASTTPASAVTYDKLAYLTFNVRVQVPGVVLGPGTYRFHLTNAETSRNVVQVLSRDGAIVYAMFNTILDRRSVLTADPVVTFRETPANTPPAVRSLFYSWEAVGYEFVYPAGGPLVVEPSPPEITYTRAPAPPAAEAVIEAAGELFVEPVPEPAIEVAAPIEPEAPAEVPATELERTASPLPLVGLGGAASLLAGLVLGWRRHRG